VNVVASTGDHGKLGAGKLSDDLFAMPCRGPAFLTKNDEARALNTTPLLPAAT
jgi:hypothetical protein